MKRGIFLAGAGAVLALSAVADGAPGAAGIAPRGEPARATQGALSLVGAPRVTVTQLGTARAGERARVEVRIENLSGPGISHIDFGDGTPAIESEGYDPGCGGPQPGGGAATDVVTHTYRYPGRWTVTARFTPKCADQPLPPFEGSGVVQVAPGRTLSNGPATPLSGELPLTCRAATSEYGTPQPPSRTMACFPDYEDADGYLTRLVVRWGDGSRATVFTFPLSKCVDPEDHWPATYVDDSGPIWGAQHRYPAKRTYLATVTATTSGCDGRDRQTRTASARVTVE